jgi:AraC-like DNA-binding protein
VDENKSFLNVGSVAVDIGDLQVIFQSKGLSFKDFWVAEAHFHFNYELHYLQCGYAQIEIDNKEYHNLNEQEICLIPPMLLHQTVETSDTIKHTAISFDLAYNKSAPEKSFSEFEYYSSIFEGIKNIIIMNGETLAPIINKIAGLGTKYDTRTEHILKSYFSVLFIELCNLLKDDILSGSDPNVISHDSDSQRLWLVENYITEYFMRDNIIESLSELLHLSSRQTDRFVKRMTGYSLSALIKRQRMLTAEMLIHSTNIPFNQIAEYVGYSSYSGFYNAFRQYFGVAPEEKRR